MAGLGTELIAEVLLVRGLSTAAKDGDISTELPIGPSSPLARAWIGGVLRSLVATLMGGSMGAMDG